MVSSSEKMLLEVAFQKGIRGNTKQPRDGTTSKRGAAVLGVILSPRSRTPSSSTPPPAPSSPPPPPSPTKPVNKEARRPETISRSGEAQFAASWLSAQNQRTSDLRWDGSQSRSECVAPSEDHREGGPEHPASQKEVGVTAVHPWRTRLWSYHSWCSKRHQHIFHFKPAFQQEFQRLHLCWITAWVRFILFRQKWKRVWPENPKAASLFLLSFCTFFFPTEENILKKIFFRWYRNL